MSKKKGSSVKKVLNREPGPKAVTGHGELKKTPSPRLRGNNDGMIKGIRLLRFPKKMVASSGE